MGDAPATIVDLLRNMEQSDASDTFITEGKQPYCRIYGEIKILDEEPIERAAFDEFFDEYLPVGAPARLEQERDMDIGVSLSETERYRLSLFYQKGALSIVARRVPLGNLDFDQLALPDTIKKFATAPRGLLLITGATGSGKSSTMAAILHHINSTQSKHIITIEDPIEFLHRDNESLVTQREVGNDTLSFANSLKHAVRQSPDVIFIGELRDLDTISTAISAAMTGHLVVTTMHTVDPMQTLERIINFFPEHLRDQVALDFSLSLVGIISQRLLHRKETDGLVPAFEVLVGTPLIREVIAKRQLDQIPELIKAGGPEGMISFTRSLVELTKNGDISAEVGAAAATHREEYLLSVQGMETGIDTLRQQTGGEENRKLNMKSLLKAAIKLGASDLILTVGSSPLLRIDGELSELNVPPLTSDGVRRLVFSVLNPPQRVKFEAEREIDFALSVNRLDAADSENTDLSGHRFRVNGFYQKGCVAGAFRVIPQKIPSAKELNIPPTIMNYAQRKSGLVLITGPTGHGKSTTLACLLNDINTRRSCHVITVEDPIEYVHTSKRAVIEQREVYADTTSFANALKFVLRQDPDVILIGEMRDPETISAALTAAETGHLVFATLHTNDCAQTIDRIIDSFPPYQQNQVRSQLASCLCAVVAQRLLPRADNKGRIAGFEIMLATTAVRSLIRDARTHQLAATIETSAKEGMITLQKALQNLHSKKLITLETMQAYTT